MAKRLRRKTGQYQNSEQAGYSQAANPEVGQSRLVDGHPANAERNKEQARRGGGYQFRSDPNDWRNVNPQGGHMSPPAV